MKILLANPKYPDTFWSWKHIMRIVRRKAAFPPLGLLTVAAMLPESWDKKVVDLNVRPLTDEDIRWADYVFVSAMITQKDSAKEVIRRCNELGVKVVAGGPLFTTGYEGFNGVDHFIVGEVEDTFPIFIEDLRNGCARKIYASDVRPDIAKAPIPLWGLINPKDYVSLSMQYSRGCPFDCEFCDITVMNGRTPRVKSTEQFLREYDAILATGFRGRVFVVDDNFIGNKKRVKKMLPEMIERQKATGYPFAFCTQSSINLADDRELMEMMVQAGFDQVFLGLETPSSAGLAECGKTQNRNRDLVDSVKVLQRFGFNTFAGLIVGFDSDDPKTIFDAQIKLIRDAGILVAMIGLLTALPKTRLYQRLFKERRLREKGSTGNNTDTFLNFEPKMDEKVLLAGYKRIISTIYLSPKEYYERVCTFLKEYNPCHKKNKRTDWDSIMAFARSIWYIGLFGGLKTSWYYWKSLLVAFFKYRQAFSEVVALWIYEAHFQKVAKEITES